MAIKGFEWVGADKFAHAVAGMMIFGLSYWMFNIEASISMMIVTIAGFVKEWFDGFRYKLGLKEGFFDKVDAVATVIGGASVCTIVGIIDLIKWML